MLVDLRRLAFDKNLNQSELGEILGIAQTQISLMMNGRRDITQTHINLLVNHFGAETIAKYTLSEEGMAATTRPIAKLTEATILPIAVADEIKSEANKEELIPYVSKDLVQARDLDIRHLVLSKSDELKYKALSDLFGDIDYIQRVITSAMMPLFQPGDLLFIKFLPNDAKVISGAIYLIDTRKYGAMVRQVYVERDHFLLCSRNPDFEELRVPRSDIYSVGLVVNMVRSDFNMPSEYPNVVQMMSNRDKQIDNLIEQIDKAGERESRLISILEGKNK